VKQGASNWFNIKVPSIFFLSTVVIIASSVSLHLARNEFRNENFGKYRLFLIVTAVLAISFIGVQYSGWSQMFESGIDLKANVAGSFFYLITGAHAAHLIGGFGALAATVINSYILPKKINENRKTKVEMLLHYWHFMGILWIYLLGFILLVK